MTRMLVAAGYSVICAANGNEALSPRANHDGPIDLLVTDVVMPQMSGKELSDKVGSVRPGREEPRPPSDLDLATTGRGTSSELN